MWLVAESAAVGGDAGTARHEAAGNGRAGLRPERRPRGLRPASNSGNPTLRPNLGRTSRTSG